MTVPCLCTCGVSDFAFFLKVSLGLGATSMEHRPRKSISTERTFRELSNPTELVEKCKALCGALADDIVKCKVVGGTTCVN